MKFRVELTRDAESDLDRLADYIATNQSVEQAVYVMDQLETVTAKLATFPERGAFPPELVALGIREYRQVFFKPYRLIYRIFTDRVVVMIIADGRRDMTALLTDRLLRS